MIDTINPDIPAPPGKLLRVLGLGFGIAAVVGGSIGSGILRTPGPVAAALPNPALILIAWTVGGLLMLVEALPLIELATMLPQAGGSVVYVGRAFGRGAGTLVGWGVWLQMNIALSFMAVVFGEYVQRLGFGSHWPTGALAAALIAGLTLVNLAGTRFSGGSQLLGTIVKVGGLVALMGAIFVAAPAAPPPAAIVPLTFLGAVVALRLITNTYAGYNAVVFLTEEMHAPGRTVAWSLLIGIGIITLLCVAMNAALLHALPVAVIAASTLPVADAVATFAGQAGGLIVTLVSIVAVVTIANLTVMYPSRVLYAMAASGALPAVFGTLAANGTPMIALLAATALTIVFASTGAYLVLIAIYAPMATITFIVTILASMRLRRTEPALARPWRMPLYPLPALIALAINLALLIAFIVEDPVHSAWSLALLALGLPLLLRSRSRAVMA